jgi:hypothetical protein
MRHHLLSLCVIDLLAAFGFTLAVRSFALRALFIAVVGVGLTIVHYFLPFALNGYWKGAYAFAPSLLPSHLAYCLVATGIGMTVAAWIQHRKAERGISDI